MKGNEQITLREMRLEFERLEDLEDQLETELENLRDRQHDLFERILIREAEEAYGAS